MRRRWTGRGRQPPRMRSCSRSDGSRSAGTRLAGCAPPPSPAAWRWPCPGAPQPPDAGPAPRGPIRGSTAIASRPGPGPPRAGRRQPTPGGVRTHAASLPGRRWRLHCRRSSPPAPSPVSAPPLLPATSPPGSRGAGEGVPRARQGSVGTPQAPLPEPPCRPASSTAQVSRIESPSVGTSRVVEVESSRLPSQRVGLSLRPNEWGGLQNSSARPASTRRELRPQTGCTAPPLSILTACRKGARQSRKGFSGSPCTRSCDRGRAGRTACPARPGRSNAGR